MASLLPALASHFCIPAESQELTMIQKSWFQTSAQPSAKPYSRAHPLIWIVREAAHGASGEPAMKICLVGKPFELN